MYFLAGHRCWLLASLWKDLAMFPCFLYGLDQGNGKHQSCCAPEGDGDRSASPQDKGKLLSLWLLFCKPSLPQQAAPWPPALLSQEGTCSPYVAMLWGMDAHGYLKQVGRKAMCVISVDTVPEKLIVHCTALLAISSLRQRSSVWFWFWLAERHLGVMSIAPASHPRVHPSVPGISTTVRATEPGLLCKQHFCIAKIITLYQTLLKKSAFGVQVLEQRDSSHVNKQIITSILFEWLHPQMWQRILQSMLQWDI